MKLNNFKKIDIIKDLNLKTGLSTNLSKKILNDLIDILNEEIKLGALNLKDIGSFKVINKKERIGRNPKTKEEFVIEARKSIIFNPSKKISKNLNLLN
tara:strand:+ start:3437 stop:3730 length:294 start_codon:yes stop_codon:yes gene_type:complete